MGRLRWVGEDLYYLLTETSKQLVIRYPEYSRGTLAGKQTYWTNKLREGKIEMPKSPEIYNPSETAHLLKPFGLENAQDADVSYHVGYIKNSDGEIEYTKPLPSVRARTSTPRRELSDFISQADPINIKPSRRKPVKRDHKLILAFGDSQIDYRQIDGEYVPIHDERALGVVAMMAKEFQPETIVNLGDTIDLAALSRFPADSDHFNHSLNPAFNRVHKMYADLRTESPNSDIHEVDSNHNTRLSKFILKQVPELYGIRQAGTSEENYPTLTYPFFANLDAVGVTWHSGYGAAEYVYGEDEEKPPIVFKHGQSVVSGGSTAAKESKENPETHVVRGHGHRAETHHRTTRAGNYLASIMVGATCSIDGDVPSYHSAIDDMGKVVKQKENWQQSLLMVTDYGRGDYQFDHVLIKDGVANYQGKEFNANGTR